MIIRAMLFGWMVRILGYIICEIGVAQNRPYELTIGHS